MLDIRSRCCEASRAQHSCSSVMLHYTSVVVPHVNNQVWLWKVVNYNKTV